jgi:hypothetical protein
MAMVGWINTELIAEGTVCLRSLTILRADLTIEFPHPVFSLCVHSSVNRVSPKLTLWGREENVFEMGRKYRGVTF